MRMSPAGSSAKRRWPAASRETWACCTPSRKAVSVCRAASCTQVSTAQRPRAIAMLKRHPCCSAHSPGPSATCPCVCIMTLKPCCCAAEAPAPPRPKHSSALRPERIPVGSLCLTRTATVNDASSARLAADGKRKPGYERPKQRCPPSFSKRRCRTGAVRPPSSRCSCASSSRSALPSSASSAPPASARSRCRVSACTLVSPSASCTPACAPCSSSACTRSQRPRSAATVSASRPPLGLFGSAPSCATSTPISSTSFRPCVAPSSASASTSRSTPALPRICAAPSSFAASSSASTSLSRIAFDSGFASTGSTS
mmetsp:Transcript_2894/g.6768  ORF Transcript_2894/g.6768 Transcript_2894/m.6768 type:complete len:313 (-) Transcript_2894:2161-3099(-)